MPKAGKIDTAEVAATEIVDLIAQFMAAHRAVWEHSASRDALVGPRRQLIDAISFALKQKH